MIKIIAGGKKPTGWQAEAIAEYEKRLRKPYNLEWQFLSEEKFTRWLNDWPFSHDDYVIICDERGTNISSDEYFTKLQQAFGANKNIIILIGGAYGFTPEDRARADFIWGFSHLVFPHALARIIVAEQTYRAQEIAAGHPYHHA